MKAISLFIMAGMVTAQGARGQSAAPARLAVKFSPLALLDPTCSTLMLGAEYRPRPRLGIELAYGLQYGDLQLGSWHKGQQELRYHKFRGELRYYLRSGTRLEQLLAAEAFFVPQRYTISSYHVGETNYNFDPAQVQRDVAGLALNYGLLWHVGNRWQLEANAGLGLRYVSVSFDVQNQRASSRGGTYEGLFERSDAPGTSLGPHVTARIKVGYELGRQ